MRPRRRLAPVLTLLSVVTLTVAVVAAVRPPAALPAATDSAAPFRIEGPDGPLAPVVEVVSAAEYDRLPALPVTKIEVPDGPDQSGCQRGGRQARVETGEGFESSPFPRPGGRWAISDLFSKSPGFLDEVSWGAVSCEASLDKKSLWSVGGGSIGKTLKCDGPEKQYYTGVHANKGAIRTLLRYGVLDLSVNRGVGVRITFDYMAKMPDKALFVGVGDGNERESVGRVNYTGYNYFQSDTKDDWVRGEIVAYANGSEYLTPVAGFSKKDRIEIAFFYTDPPNADGLATPGVGSPTAGMYGAFIDNVHIDVLIDPRPCPIGSPTATSEPFTPTPLVSNTPEETDPPTRTPRATRTPRPTPPPIDFKTPTPRDRRAFLPFLIRSLNILIDLTRPPVGKTATPTPIPSATRPPTATLPPPPTETDEPTETPVPTRTRRPTQPPTPTYTPRPTATSRPYPQVIIADVIPYTPGSQFEAVVLMNVGTGPQDLTGWRTVGASRSQKLCDLPNGYVLAAGVAMEIRSGKDATAGMRDNEKFGSVDGIVCTKEFIWDNNQDQASLFDLDGQPISKFCWDLEGPYICP